MTRHEKSPAEKLKSELGYQRDHLKDGNQRIKAWYSEEYEPPEDLPPLDEPPHQSLMKRSAKLIVFASGPLIDRPGVFDQIETDAELLIYGVALEGLLSAIHLKLNPESFVDYLDDREETPPFDTCKSAIVSDISDQLPSDQCGMMVVVLDIVREHRNNEAHLGFHRYQQFRLRRLILEVSYLLFKIYSEVELPELDTIKEKIDDRRARETPSAHEIEFDLTSIE